MKKLLCILMAAVMLFSCTVAAIAADMNVAIDGGEEFFICESADGVFTTVQAKGVNEVIKIVPEKEYDNIYYSVDKDIYFQKANDSEFIPVEKVVFQLTDYAEYKNIQDYMIPDEVLDGIASMAAWAQENNNEDARGVIFVAESNTKSGLNTYPMTTTTWDGYTFHHYQVYFKNMWTSWQTIAEQGSTTKAVLTTIKEISMFLAGYKYEELGTASSLFSGGKSCLEAWQAQTGKTPIYGNLNNKVMVDIQYDIYLKYTYNYNPVKGDVFGCATQKATITRIDTDTYLYTSSGGERSEKTVYPNKTYYTPHYQEPEPEAILYLMGNTGPVESVKGSIIGKEILFSFPDFTWPSDWP